MEQTMFHAYCHAANFLAFLKDSSPDHDTILARLRKAVKDRNFQTERHWGETTTDNADAGDSHPAEEAEVAVLKRSIFGRDAQEIRLLSRFEQRNLTYRPHGKCPWIFYKDDVANPTRAGRLLQLYHFKRGGEYHTAALVESYIELSNEEAVQGDYYRKWEPLAGRLYNIDTTPSIIIPAQGIVHHAIHREYSSKELKKMVRHLMPISKASFSVATVGLALILGYVPILQDPVYEGLRADEAYYGTKSDM
jgi:hypothetical protein